MDVKPRTPSPRDRRRDTAFVSPATVGVGLLLVAVLAPALPPPFSIAVMLLAAGAWWLLRASRREGLPVATALLVATVALTVGWVVDLVPSWRSRESWSRLALERYEACFADLKGGAALAAGTLEALPEALASMDRDARGQAFRRLAELTRRAPLRRATLLLLNPDGEAVAWAGEGLLHNVPPEELPTAGVHHFASYTAATLVAVEPLGEGRRPWRVVAGRSFATAELPFDPPFGESRSSYRWSLVTHGTGNEADFVLQPRAGPRMAIESRLEMGETHGHVLGSASMVRWVWGLVGLVLVALAVLRGVAWDPSGDAPGGRLSQARRLAPLVLGGIVAWGLVAGASPLGLLVLGLVLTLVLVGFSLRWRLPRGWMGVAVAATGLVLTAGLGEGYQVWRGPVDLGTELLVGGDALVTRLVIWSLTLGVLCLARAGRRETVPGDRWAWLSLAFFLLAGGFHDVAALGLFLLAAGGGAAAVWLGSGHRLRQGASWMVLALLATLAGAAGWETSYRVVLRRWLGEEVLPRMAPPSPVERDALERQVAGFFASRDLSELVSGDPWELGRQDLALAMWRESPLARSDAFSSLVVEPFDGAGSSFAYGLPPPGLVEDEREDPWQEGAVPSWSDAAAAGTVELLQHGERWAQVRYTLVPILGFDVGDNAVEELEVDLLRGGPTPPGKGRRLPGSAVSCLYGRDGTARWTPWGDAPPLSPELASAEPGGVRRVETPMGRAWAWAEPLGEGAQAGIHAIYLPFLSPVAGLERTAIHALSVLFFLGAGAVLTLLLALPRLTFRESLRRNFRSYSKRLIIVYTVLLLIPLLLLNLVLYRSVGERLKEEQRAAGELALDSAQRVLADYVYSLEPGFAIDTALDYELLLWLSQVVHHEVNVYWGSSIHTSSKPELFTAGLLPRRIPGEIFSRLVLVDYALASRTNRAGRESTYLELYAPLAGQESLFLSIPLLAQQEEVASELVYRGRQALLITAALFLLLGAVGMRLARSFTTPLMQIVEGTRRIAGGATSLGLDPSEPELASLVQAIDEMARRIARGRSELLREKTVVERMVQNITSGVVSLDQNLKVLLHNRVARDLLGVEVGEDLAEIAKSEALAPVASFLATPAQSVARTTARLRTDGGEEREWTLIWVPVPGEGDPVALLVVEDVTEVLRGQRLEAWAEMARIIAHEIKNPLTPIRLSTEHLRQVYTHRRDRLDEVFERCTSNILNQVQELYEISSEFSIYSHIPRTQPQLGDLVAAVSKITDGYRAAPPPGVRVEFSADPRTLQARFDAKLLGRAVRNLVENALRASSEGGEVRVHVQGSNGVAKIAVTDEGPGVPAEHLSRIFDPYFSTHSGGTGLGLPIARRIAEEHGGEISATNRDQGGLEVSITMPTAGG